MQTFTIGKRHIIVNDTNDDIVFDSANDRKDIIETYIREIISLPPNVRRALDVTSVHSDKYTDFIKDHDVYVDAVLQEHANGHVLLSPRHFTYLSEHRVTNRAASKIVQGTNLGQSLTRDLGEVGLCGFIDKLQTRDNKVRYRTVLTRIMTSLCCSVGGVQQVSDLPPDALLCWMSFFRNETNSRWKPELWGSANSAVIFQCIRELVYAYGRYTGHNEVSTRVLQLRSDSKNPYWNDFERNPSPRISPWLKLFEAWRERQPAFAKTYRQMFMHIARWLDSFEPALVENVTMFMATPSRKPSLLQYIMSLPHGRSPTGSTFVQTCAYAKRFSEFIAEELSLGSNGQGFFHLVNEADMRTAKNAAQAKGMAFRGAEAKSCPLPLRLYQEVRQILAEGEEGWPGKIGLCQEVVLCPDGVTRSVYCPVLPTLFLSLFEIPLRVGQMKRLDSGEGDLRRFDGETMTWGPNTSTMAGYWAKQRQGKENCGYAHHFDGKPPITGFAINTNKTGNPYVIPWQNETLHRMFYRLRQWQETYNPIKAPIGPALYVDGVHHTDAGKLNDYPDIFPLFRLPADSRGGRQCCPPNARRTNGFWHELMAELERRWNAFNHEENHIQIVEFHEKTGQPYSAKYNAHGLRVAGLTLMVQTKVPIEVISKLIAGHKTILMTLYYIKPDPATVHAALDEAAQAREADTVAASFRDLKTASFEAAQKRAAFISDDGLRAATAIDASNKMLWSDTGLGICPWDGTRCSDGGPRLRKEQYKNGRKANVYASVEGGEGNCILCRHFITGPAWRTPLWLYGSKLMREFAALAGEIGNLQQELDRLYESHVSADGLHPRQKRPPGLERYETEINRLSHDQEILGKAIWNVHRLLEMCAEIEAKQTPDDSDSPGGALIAHDTTSVVEYVTVSEFEQAAFITAAGRIYPVVQDAEAEAARNRFLDALMWHSGEQPLTFAPLPEDVKRRGLDALARFILARVKREEMAALADGSLRLQDLELHGDAVAVVSAAVGQPIRIAKPSSGSLNFPTLEDE
jgi:hypothetical protein